MPPGTGECALLGKRDPKFRTTKSTYTKILERYADIFLSYRAKFLTEKFLKYPCVDGALQPTVTIPCSVRSVTSKKDVTVFTLPPQAHTLTVHFSRATRSGLHRVSRDQIIIMNICFLLDESFNHYTILHLSL